MHSGVQVLRIWSVVVKNICISDQIFFSRVAALGQIKQNLTGSIYGRSSKISSFHTDWTKTMITMGNSCFWFAEIFKNLLKLGGTMNFYFVWMMYWRSCTKFLYFVPILQLIWKFLFKKSSLKTFGQINWNLVGSTYGRFCIKVPENKMTGEWHSLSPLNL
jgi:hypothetical protein